MKKLRNILSIIAAILIVINMFEFNYNNLSWKEE